MEAKLFSVAGPVTIADRTAEEAMVAIIQDNFPSHAMWVLILQKCLILFSVLINWIVVLERKMGGTVKKRLPIMCGF